MARDLVTLNLTGLKELQEALENQLPSVAKKIVRQSLRDAAKLVKDAIVEMAPKDTGFLSEHFNIQMRVEKNGIAARAFVGPVRKAYYPGVGSRSAGVSTGKRPKKGGALPVVSVARFQEYGTSRMAAHPFMRPAFMATAQAAVDKIIEGIRKSLAKLGR